MATNKHAMIRYQALDRCFRNPGRKYYMDDLVEACNDALYEYSGGNSSVKKRQIFEDIKFMESSQGWNSPLAKIKDGRRVYYRYEDLDFSINNQLLNEREELQLKEALNTISRFKGMPQFAWIEELTAKLQQGLKLDKRKDKIIEFEQNQYLKGLEYITPIYEAIQNEQAITVKYQSFKQDEPITLVISPYFLKQYNNRWFLLGATEGFSNLTTLALDRVKNISTSSSQYNSKHGIDFEDYFEDVVGVTVKQEVKAEKIRIRIDKSLYPYIKTKPIHGSQKYLGNDGGEIIELELIPNYELESLLLSFGEQIEIISPEDLRRKIRLRLNKTIKRYD
jgi:predicted DNA-binding transcriptional regulator YafY